MERECLVFPCLDRPEDIAFGSDGFAYVADVGNKRVGVWSKDGTFKRDFKTKCTPYHIVATSDNHLVILSRAHNTVMVYTLDGQLIHQFGTKALNRGCLTIVGEFASIAVDWCI